MNPSCICFPSGTDGRPHHPQCPLFVHRPYNSAVIGVDYSGSAAYLAVIRNRELLAQRELKIGDRLYSFFHDLQGCLDEWKNTFQCAPELWIEQQMPIGRNIGAGQKLSAMERTLELAALEVDLEPCFIHPGTWRKRVYGHGAPHDPKEHARTMAKGLFGFEVRHKNQHNICEGMMIAYYGYLQHDPEAKPL